MYGKNRVSLITRQIDFREVSKRLQKILLDVHNAGLYTGSRFEQYWELINTAADEICTLASEVRDALNTFDTSVLGEVFTELVQSDEFVENFQSLADVLEEACKYANEVIEKTDWDKVQEELNRYLWRASSVSEVERYKRLVSLHLKRRIGKVYANLVDKLWEANGYVNKILKMLSEIEKGKKGILEVEIKELREYVEIMKSCMFRTRR